MSHPDDPRAAGRVALAVAEAGLLVVALGVAASFTRLFQGWDWLPRLAVPVTVAWATALLTRRAGLRVSVAVAVQSLVGILVLSWMFAPGTLLLILPTPTTWTVLVDQVAASFSSFSELVAPVPATDGFLVIIAAALWVIAGFADTAAVRFRAPLQAAVPYVSTFAAVGILARDAGRTAAALLFALALALYAASQMALGATDRRWVGGRAARGARAVFASTLAVALLAVVGGALLGPRLPGTAEPVVDLRELGKGNGPRTVVSPFVGIRSLLGDRSNQVMFTVQADTGAYWRLTALERYDPEREIWVSRGNYQRTNGELPPTMAPDVGGEPLRQQFRIDALSTLWLPAAYVPRQVDSDAELSFDTASSSLILRDRDAGGELDYTLESVVPAVAPLLENGAVPLRTELDAEYLQVAALDPGVRELVRSVTAQAQDPYNKMLALQTWFRDTFSYDDRVDFSQEPDALAAFLAARRGFCQQFSSAFALFARELGVPSRVAVGFTQGDTVRTTTGGAGGDVVEFVVRGRHAHAWPEVYFEGIGWVPFEPTPQRGNPQAQAYTGVAPDQASAPPEQAATTTSTSVPPSTTTTAPTSSPDRLDATAAPDERSRLGDGSTAGWLLGAVFVVVALGLVGLLAVFAARRRQERSVDERTGRNAEIAAAWSDAVRALGLIGLRPAPSETPLEFARRADGHLGEQMVTPLARNETRRRFGLGTPSASTCDDARRRASRVVDHVRSVTSRRQRVTSRMGR